jgi:hypothetical protein
VNGLHLKTSEVAQALRVDLSPSRLVAIDDYRLDLLTQSVRRQANLAAPPQSHWDNARFWNTSGTLSERSQYFTIGNAINFRFWEKVNGRLRHCGGVLRGDSFVGSMYMWRCLRLCLEENKAPLLDAAFLAALSDDEFDLIFFDDHGVNPLHIAREERILNLRNLGLTLQDNWDGEFYNLVLTARGSLLHFSRLSGAFRAFDDPLLKLTMVNAILHSQSGVSSFDATPLPGIDYNIVRQLLRQGVLLPCDPLADKLKGTTFLTSREALELRRTALSALVKLSDDTGLPSDIVDNSLWNNRVHCNNDSPVCQAPTTARQCPFLDSCARIVEFRVPLEETRYY